MEELMKRMKHPSHICKMQSFLPMEGYLSCQEKCKCTRCLYRSLILSKLLFWTPSEQRLSSFCSSQQGLWVCHGSNIIASITRREDCWSWCLVSRSLRLNRCFTEKKYAIIPTYQPLMAQTNICVPLIQCSQLMSWGCSLCCHCLLDTYNNDHFPMLPAGPHVSDAEILHPPEDGLHRQALLLWRGN